jgi:nucleoside-diphosphate-sugar epimerase
VKALVTGSTGFIGSHLVESLLQKKYEVFCLIREQSDRRWIKELDVRFIPGDYEDKVSLNGAVKDMDFVFHCGAVIFATEWETYDKANVESTVNILKACAETNPGLKKFIFVSSISASGPSLDGKPVKESDPCRPVSLYGKSKRLAEEAAANFFDKFPVVSLRPTNVLGIRQEHLFRSIKLAAKSILPCLGNGDNQVTFSFVQDVVRALILAAEEEKAHGKAYFVADPEPRSWDDLLSAILESLGKSFVVRIPQRILMSLAFLSEKTAGLTGRSPLFTRKSLLNIRNNYWLQDTELIEKDLGFVTKIPFKQGIGDIVHWYRDNNLL